eukprot:snap_masked-scaffold_13-processed-gene-11.34-mRNA-1 protein AED:1.00 eAED:1.00 QI:0/0/0/0/1/1/2/0/65
MYSLVTNVEFAMNRFFSLDVPTAYLTTISKVKNYYKLPKKFKKSHFFIFLEQFHGYYFYKIWKPF